MVVQTIHKIIRASTYLVMFTSIGCHAITSHEINNISINNAIEDCIKIKQISNTSNDNAVFLNAKLLHIKNVGYCGCKSAMLSYFTTTNSVESRTDEGKHNVLLSSSDNKYTFVIDDAYTSSEGKSYTLNIQCASPDY